MLLNLKLLVFLLSMIISGFQMIRNYILEILEVLLVIFNYGMMLVNIVTLEIKEVVIYASMVVQ